MSHSEAAYMRAYAHRNAEKLRAYHAAYYRRNRHKWAEYNQQLREVKAEQRKAQYPAKKDTLNATRRAARAADPEKYRALDRNRDKAKKRVKDTNWRLKNAAKVAASIARSKAAKPELYRQLAVQRSQRRRHRIRLLPVCEVDRGAIVQRDNGICHLCSFPVPSSEISLDHLIPVVRGGAFAEWNLMLAHLTCNRRRRDKRILPVETESAARQYIAEKIGPTLESRTNPIKASQNLFQ